MIDLNKAEKLAIRMARTSGHMLMENLNKITIVEQKDKEDFCTNMDIKIENFLIHEIQKAYPTHNVLSEEIGDLKKESDYTWILDPIDGTKNFMKNIPLFAVSIGLEYKGEIVLGVIFNPSTHHLYRAQKGKGAYLNNKPITVSESDQIDHSFIYLEIAKIHEIPKKEMQQAIERLNKLVTETYRIRTMGFGSIGMCYLAQGAYDVFFDLTGEVKYVDIAAGSIIVQEAGGFILDLNGRKVGRKTKHFLATNAKLKDKIVELLTK